MTSRRVTRQQLERELVLLADPKRAESSAWFFKTGKGQYGEGDRFLGIRVPVQRRIARKYLGLPLRDIARLLVSPIHEHRFTALEILVAQYERAEEGERNQIFNFYLNHASRINNWDLVDTSAPYIVGEHLRNRPRQVLDALAHSESVWERRIAVVSTLAFVKHGEVEDTFRICGKLLSDKHDLIRKAVGWALRETGRVSRRRLLRFLKTHYSSLSRTSLRYAIEHFSAAERKQMLAGDFT